jgi:hypothetical protein
MDASPSTPVLLGPPNFLATGFLELKCEIIRGGMEKYLTPMGPTKLHVHPIFEIGPVVPRFSEVHLCGMERGAMAWVGACASNVRIACKHLWRWHVACLLSFVLTFRLTWHAIQWLVFEGISVDESGKQHYLDASVAYKRAVLDAINYLSKFGYTREQVRQSPWRWEIARVRDATRPRGHEALCSQASHTHGLNPGVRVPGTLMHLVPRPCRSICC